MPGYKHPWHSKTFTKPDQVKHLVKEAQASEGAKQRGRLETSLQYGALFEGCTLSTLTPVGYQRSDRNVFRDRDIPLIRQKCRSLVKGAHALLWGNDDPLPQFMAVGGDWKIQTQARLRNRAIDSEFDQPQGRFDNTHDLWRHSGLVAMAAVGSCAVFALPGWEKVRARFDDTLSMSIETNGRQGEPLGVITTDFREPEELAIEFPKLRDAILYQAQEMKDPGTGVCRWVVPVRCGWRVKIRDTDGVQIQALDSGESLVHKPYKRTELPCVFWHFERELFGDWGFPLTAYVYTLLMHQNRLTHDTEKTQRNAPQGIIQGSEKQKQKAAGDARGWTWIPSENPAEDARITAPPMFNSQALELAEAMGRWADEDSMVNAAHSTAGGDRSAKSGYHEQLKASYFTEAFAPESRRAIHARTVGTGKRYVWALQDMIEDGREITRMWERGSLVDEITVNDLDLDDARYLTRIASVSEDKNSPQSILEDADRWLEQRTITGAEWLKMRETYDRGAVGDRIAREEQWVEEQMEKWLHAPEEKFLEEGFYQSPRKHMVDLPGIAQRVQGELQWAESRGAPPERLEFFELFLEELGVLIEQEKAQSATTIKADAGAAEVFPGLGGASGTGTGQPPGLPAGGAPGAGIPAV